MRRAALHAVVTFAQIELEEHIVSSQNGLLARGAQR